MSLYFIVLSFAVTVFVFLVAKFVKKQVHNAVLKKLPGLKGNFLIGNIGWLMKLYYIYGGKLKHHPGVYILERIKGSAELYRKSGLYVFWVGQSPIVSVHSADSVEKILTSNVSLEKSFEYSFLHKWLGLGLLTSTGQRWRSRRKVLTPAFHFRILEDFLPTFNEQSNILIKKLKTLVHEDYIDITPLIILCTLDIVCETMMGSQVGAQKGENSNYVTAIHNLADFFNRRSFSPWLWYDFLFNCSSIGRQFNRDLHILHNFTKRVIREKKAKLVNRRDSLSSIDKDEIQSKKRKALMDLLLDLQMQGEQLSEEDIQEEIDTFMFEGHDTTAMGIIYALYCIGLYPEIQNKMYEEIESIFGQDTERAITMEDVRHLKYLECTLKESHRIYPSVPLIGRKLNEDIYVNDCLIPSGTTMHCNIIALHRDHRVFPQPEIFDPDRFLPENSLNRHPYSYVPFSAGPRNCIGQKFALLEEKVTVCNILRHFRIVSIDPRDQVHMKIEFTLRPAQPIRLKLIQR